MMRKDDLHGMFRDVEEVEKLLVMTHIVDYVTYSIVDRWEMKLEFGIYEEIEN